MTEKIVVERQGQCLLFYVTTKLDKEHPSAGSRIFYAPLRPTSEDSLRKLTEGAENLVRRILKLNGVNSIMVYLYSLRVEIAKAFSCEEIMPIILSAIKTFLKYRNVEVVRTGSAESIILLP